MPIATSTALLIGGLAAAGSQAAGSVIQSKSSKHAADTQAQAADRALAYEQQRYQQAQRDYDAWLTGADMGRLSDYVGGAQDYTVPEQTSGPSGAFAMPAGSGPRFSELVPVGASATPAAQAARVQLTAPDGSTALVPIAKVPYYRQKWAAMGAR